MDVKGTGVAGGAMMAVCLGVVVVGYVALMAVVGGILIPMFYCACERHPKGMFFVAVPVFVVDVVLAAVFWKWLNNDGIAILFVDPVMIGFGFVALAEIMAGGIEWDWWLRNERAEWMRNKRAEWMCNERVKWLCDKVEALDPRRRALETKMSSLEKQQERKASK